MRVFADVSDSGRPRTLIYEILGICAVCASSSCLVVNSVLLITLLCYVSETPKNLKMHCWRLNPVTPYGICKVRTLYQRYRDKTDAGRRCTSRDGCTVSSCERATTTTQQRFSVHAAVTRETRTCRLFMKTNAIGAHLPIRQHY